LQLPRKIQQASLQIAPRLMCEAYLVLDVMVTESWPGSTARLVGRANRNRADPVL